MTDNFDHALEKENRRLNVAVDAERALTEKALALVKHQQGIINNLSAEVERLTRERDELAVELEEEVIRWQTASGLECGGDPGGVTPDMLERHVQQLERERDEWKASHARQENRADEAETHADAMAKERDEARQERDLAYSNGVGGAAKRIQELQAERDEAQRALLLEQQLREAHREAAEDLRRWKDAVTTELREWQARAEAAEADNAEFIRALNIIENDISEGRPEDAQREAIAAMEGEHPGAALLEERDNWKRMHEANVEAGARVAAEFDKAGVGRSGDGVLTRALALLELHNAVRQYQQRDEPDTLATFRRLMEERGRFSERIPANDHQSVLEALQAEEREVAALLGVIYDMDKATYEALIQSGPAKKAAALLERLRAAEKVVEAVRKTEWILHSPHEADDTVEALAAYDAAKEGK